MQYISALPSWNTVEEHHTQKKLAVMGSTGSIGKNTLKIAQDAPHKFSIYALAGGKNIKLLAEQANSFRPKLIAIQHKEDITELKKLLTPNYYPEIVAEKEGYTYIASHPQVDMLVSAQVGAAGLHATVAACQSGKTICLANKESLVLAGDIIRSLAKSHNAVLLPVDSEHYALFQCLFPSIMNTEKSLQERYLKQVSKLILTASGGPFRGKDISFLEKVTKEDALKHPNWNMGAKISIDSATLMNKGLEIIEAHHLYNIPLEQISVLVHPQSIIHSMVEWQDGSIMAQLAEPNMRLPIAACMMMPELATTKINTLNVLDLTQYTLTFEQADTETFPCLNLARKAHAQNLCIELNAANEVAVELFLNDAIGFTDIPRLIQSVLETSVQYRPFDLKSLNIQEALSQIETRDTTSRALAYAWRNSSM